MNSVAIIWLKDSLIGTLYAPVWWYTNGFFSLVRGLLNSIANLDATFGFTLWFRNIFTPLFNQTDFASRVISFFIRLVNMVIRGIIMIFLIIIHIAILAIWIILPPILIYRLFV